MRCARRESCGLQCFAKQKGEETSSHKIPTIILTLDSVYTVLYTVQCTAVCEKRLCERWRTARPSMLWWPVAYTMTRRLRLGLTTSERGAVEALRPVRPFSSCCSREAMVGQFSCKTLFTWRAGWRGWCNGHVRRVRCAHAGQHAGPHHCICYSLCDARSRVARISACRASASI